MYADFFNLPLLDPGSKRSRDGPLINAVRTALVPTEPIFHLDYHLESFSRSVYGFSVF
jgi:hypothetical protein